MNEINNVPEGHGHNLDQLTQMAGNNLSKQIYYRAIDNNDKIAEEVNIGR
jgi:hypothetical protein